MGSIEARWFTTTLARVAFFGCDHLFTSWTLLDVPKSSVLTSIHAIISNLTQAPREQMLWRWYWKAWPEPTLVVGGQFGSLPLILPRFCPDQTILIIAFDPKHRFSHLLYSAIHIHSNLKRIPMATKRFPEGGKKPPCLRFSLPGGMDQRWGVIRSWGQPHGLVWDVIFREVFCVFFLWKEQLGEWGCAHCEAKGFTQGCRQNTKADKWVLRQNGKVDEQKQESWQTICTKPKLTYTKDEIRRRPGRPGK